MTTIIMGSGRCGTLTAAYIAATILDVDTVEHESCSDFAAAAYGAVTGQVWSTSDILDAVKAWAISAPDVYADLHCSFLVPWLAMLSHTRFVHLVRDPLKTVASMMRCGWYDPDADPDSFHERWRIPAPGASQVERCALFWTEANRTAADDLHRFARHVTLTVLADDLDKPTVRARFRSHITGNDEAPGPNLRTEHQLGDRESVVLSLDDVRTIGDICGPTWARLQAVAL